MIFKAVIDLSKENLGYLTGAGVDPETQMKFIESVKKVDGVEDVHHIITDHAGPKLLVEMHINVDGNMTLNEAHEICDRVSDVLTAFPEVDRAYVHVEPIGYE